MVAVANLPPKVAFRNKALMDSVFDNCAAVDGFLRIISIASFIVNFEYVSRIFGSAICKFGSHRNETFDKIWNLNQKKFKKRVLIKKNR